MKRCGSWKSSWCVRVRVFMCVCVCLCVSIHRTTEECTDARITPQMQVLVSVQVPQKKSCLSRFPLGAGPLRAGLNVFTGPFCGRVAAAKRPQNGPTAPAKSWPRDSPEALRGWSSAQARLALCVCDQPCALLVHACTVRHRCRDIYRDVTQHVASYGAVTYACRGRYLYGTALVIDKIPVWYRTGLGRYLYGTALVPSAEGIYQSDVYFGSVESAVTRLDTVLAPCERERE